METSKMGGARESEPHNKSGDFFCYPSALKIICSIAYGNITRKNIEKREIIYLDRWDKSIKTKLEKNYLSAGTLNKFLSGKPRNLISEGLLLITNEINDKDRKRRTKSKVDYEFAINYDLILTRFRQYIIQKIDESSNGIKEASYILCHHLITEQDSRIQRLKNERSFDIPANKWDDEVYRALLKNQRINMDVKAIYLHFQKTLKFYNARAKSFKKFKFSNGDKAFFEQIFQGLLYNYYLSCREDKTLVDIFEILLNQIAIGSVATFKNSPNKMQGIPVRLRHPCDEGTLKELKSLMNILRAIDCFDLWGKT